jgi:hypothetical protein
MADAKTEHLFVGVTRQSNSKEIRMNPKHTKFDQSDKTTPLSDWHRAAMCLTSHVPELPIDELEKYHPMLLTARRAINLADADSTVATRESNPDWSVDAIYGQRGSQYPSMVSFGISIPLPVNRAQKQNRNIAEKSALGSHQPHTYPKNRSIRLLQPSKALYNYYCRKKQ